MSDPTDTGGAPQKSGVSIPADPNPPATPKSPTGTLAFGDPPDTGGGPPKSGVGIINSPAEKDAKP